MKKRPIFVWVICIVYLLSVPAALYQGFVVSPGLASGSVPTNEGMKAFYAAHIVSIKIFFVVSSLLALSGATLLFQLRRGALYLIGAGFLLSVLNFLYQCFGEDLLDTIPEEAMTGFIMAMAIVWALNAATVGYVGYLYFARVLR